MRLALVSQRVEVLAERGERRDALDQRLLAWLADCGVLGVALPNNLQLLEPLWQRLQPQAVVLSGGNDLASLGGDAPERDALERALVARAIAGQVPVFALCRGAQLLLEVFGSRLEAVDGHVGTQHQICLGGQPHAVNSYHQWGCRELASPLYALARSADGVVEAFAHQSLPILGVMWHPERQTPFAALDRQLLEQCLNRELHP